MPAVRSCTGTGGTPAAASRGDGRCASCVVHLQLPQRLPQRLQLLVALLQLCLLDLQDPALLLHILPLRCQLCALLLHSTRLRDRAFGCRRH